MSRQTQNFLMAGLACAVAAVAMIAVTLVLTGDDGSTVASVDPASGGAGRIEADQATADAATPQALADPAGGAATRSTLDVARTAPSSTSTTMSTLRSTSPTTRARSTAAPTTAAPATAAPATAAPASEATPSTGATSETTPSTGGTTPSTGSSGGGDPSTTVQATSSTAPPATKPPTTQPPTTKPAITLPPETSAPTTTTTTTAGGGSLNAIEREIARLTNELRTNPNGPLKRQGAVINCGGRIRVNGAGNGYESIGALSLHEGASLQVARPWSAQMSRSNFKHRPNAGVDALQSIGVSIRSAGENIAYHSYSDKAMTHFTGWRESDGHYCNMMDPGFTHIGVGEVTKSDGLSYATQNFFSTR